MAPPHRECKICGLILSRNSPEWQENRLYVDASHTPETG